LEKLIQFFQKLLSLSHAESKGFIKLLFVCLLAIALLYLPGLLFRGETKATAEDVRELDSLANELQRKTNSQDDVALFSFNPNTIPVDSLVLLGFDKDIALRIDKYRDRGGRFLIKSDLKKIYGLRELEYVRIANHINLPDSLTTKPIEDIPWNLNSVTAAELERIPHISRVLASRIVKYRELLGGYIAEKQLDEVYGISEEALATLKNSLNVAPTFKPRMIRVNQDPLEVLQSHPYISDVLARDMIRFREINATIESEKVLANFKSIDKGSFEKLILYLDFR
jgi:DNA uptake protein ComE-like DNA-binding protein